MSEWPRLNFPPIKLSARKVGEQIQVLHLRRGWLELTPEEWVRRHVVAWLEGEGIEQQRIVEEYPIPLNGQPQRADVVVVDCGCRPRLLVECKAPEVALSQQTLDQVVRYNSVLGADFMMLTNGMEHRLYARHEGLYRPLTLKELIENL